MGDGRETVEVLGPHWRLDTRRYYSEASTSNYERVEESLERVVFALLPDGSLKRAVIIKFVVAVRYPNDESYSNHHVQDLDSDDIALFDFSQDDYRGKVSGSLRGEYVNNTVPGKRLLAHAKGVGLSLALKKLLT